MKNLLGTLPRLNCAELSDGIAVKVSLGLTEAVKGVVEKRYPGFRITRRAALETVLAEWLRRQQGDGE